MTNCSNYNRWFKLQNNLPPNIREMPENLLKTFTPKEKNRKKRKPLC